MPSVRTASAPSTAPTALAGDARVRPGRKPAAAVAIAVAAAGMMLGGCEYTYDDGRNLPGPVEAEATRLPGPVFTRDPLQNDPVSEEETGAWAARTLPDPGQPVASAGAGLVAAGNVRTESTPVLGTGTYVLSLACRSQRRVTFTVRSESLTLVDLGLRCGINRENVIYLSSETALTIRVEARTGANYAYRLRLL
ncbi:MULTISPECIES: hypothetical protein [Pseudarthrobacter]|uniref:hypothetical protein n=1 Tax=Pseudarthrobacter TaxID=1742993 RepID=UPI0020400596|nr:hypothetical protein [Pseudarthrobacter sp. NCCP-2145]GKV72650.1 hypothetical protein NCCP2145_20310 [Pseudarthrobacter sp. NCCP-2145]